MFCFAVDFKNILTWLVYFLVYVHRTPVDGLVYVKYSYTSVVYGLVYTLKIYVDHKSGYNHMQSR